MIGTGAISHKHAQAYKNIGFQLTVCTDIFEAAGRRRMRDRRWLDLVWSAALAGFVALDSLVLPLSGTIAAVGSPCHDRRPDAADGT